jgi:hypothetical protein
MKKLISRSPFLMLLVLTIGISKGLAQVGVGTTNPQAALDVAATNNGLLIPRVALSATNVATILTPTISELVYNTFTSATGPNQVVLGFYYWNGTSWGLLQTATAVGDWSKAGNSGTVATANFIGTTDAVDFVTRTNNTEKMRISATGNMGIGTPAPVSKLDVAAGVTTTNSVINATGSINDFLQFNVQNTSTGTQAQSGYSATADNGNATSGFAWMGINNSTFNFPTAYNIGVANDVSYIGSGQDLYIANANNTKSIIFSTGRAATPFFNERMRILNDGRVSINNSAPAAGDLFTVTSSTTNTYAINGYSANNGSGVYGAISSGTTIFGGVQGEYKGTNVLGAGTRGITFSPTAGTTLTNSNSGVNGQLGVGNGNSAFSFAVKGQCLSNGGNQVGGVIGISSTGDYGMLGYRRSSGTSYSVLGNIAYQLNTARSANRESSSVGLGINGGYLGGHIKGDQYGLITKGARFGSYVDGTSITNKTFAVINENQNGEKVVTYATSSTTIDLSTKGVGRLVNGTATIIFDKNFSKLTSKSTPAIVTITPMGETNGVYVTNVTENGFTTIENKGGNATTDFYWMAIGEKETTASDLVPSEVLEKDFDKNIDNVLNIDEDSKSNSNTMWWDGKNLKFGSLPKNLLHATQNQSQQKIYGKN